MSEKTSTLAQPVSGNRSNRKISWDLVRSGCVAFVMLYHATFLSVYLHPELLPRKFWFPYQVGASLLLVISAYFACVTIRKGPLLRYWWNRVARLLPPFLGAVLVIYLAMRLTPFEGWFYPTGDDLTGNLLMLWNWSPESYAYLDGSHWTVPLQLMGFSAAALLYKTKWGHDWHIIGVLWAAVLLPIAQWPIRTSNPPEAYRMILDGIGAHRWHLFVVGVVIWLWSTKRIGTAHFGAILALCMLGQSLHNYSETPEGLIADWGSTMGVCVGMVCVALTAYGPDWNKIVPDWAYRPIQWFAGISYGVFLMHQTMGYLVSRNLQDWGFGPTTQTIAMVATGVLLGWALTKIVERPVHKFLMASYDRMFPRRAAAPAS